MVTAIRGWRLVISHDCRSADTVPVPRSASCGDPMNVPPPVPETPSLTRVRGGADEADRKSDTLHTDAMPRLQDVEESRPLPERSRSDEKDGTSAYPERTRNGQVRSVPRTSPMVSGTRYTEHVDLAAVLAGGIEAEQPVLLHRDDQRPLLYRAAVNVLQGDPEGGKTWVLKAATAEALTAGQRAAFIDVDHNGATSTADHLLRLFVPKEILTDAERFRYYEPEDAAHLRRIVADLIGWRPAVVGVDSLGEVLPMLGYNSNDSDDFSTANREVLRPMARSGACVVVIDHLAKNTTSRAFGSTGSAAKQRTPDGVVLRVSVLDTYAPGQGGASSLEVWKDRKGGVRVHCPQGRNPSAGTFRLHPENGGGLSWSVSPPNGQERPSAQTAALRDADALSALAPPPTSVAEVKAGMGWGTDRAAAALRAYRVPDAHSQARGTERCRACGDPLDDVQGTGLHPNCEESA